MKIRFFEITLMCSMSFLILGISSSACRLAEAADQSIIMFIPTTEWPPYLMNDPRFPDGGVFVEVLKTIAQPAGYSVKTVQLPNKRGWMMLENGRVDVHAKAREWVTNPENFLWSAPFMLNEDVLLYSVDAPLEYSCPEALYGKSIAAMQGFAYPALESHFGPDKIHRIDVASPYAMLELLDRGRVDAALVNRVETQWLFRNKPEIKPERFVMDETPCDSASYRFAFTKNGNWQSFIDTVNKALVTMQADGRLKDIMNKYR